MKAGRGGTSGRTFLPVPYTACSEEPSPINAVSGLNLMTLEDEPRELDRGLESALSGIDGHREDRREDRLAAPMRHNREPAAHYPPLQEYTRASPTGPGARHS